MKAEFYIRQNQDNAVIAKLKTNQPLTSADVKVLEGILLGVCCQRFRQLILKETFARIGTAVFVKRQEMVRTVGRQGDVGVHRPGYCAVFRFDPEDVPVLCHVEGYQSRGLFQIHDAGGKETSDVGYRQGSRSGQLQAQAQPSRFVDFFPVVQGIDTDRNRCRTHHQFSFALLVLQDVQI